MSTPIFTYIDGRIPVHCHEHLAVLDHGGGEAAWAAEFLREGLGRGHRCCYLASATLHPAMRRRLGELDIDVERHLNRRSLQFPPEAHEADEWLEGAKKFFAETEDAPALRWLEEGVGTKPAGISMPQFFELHSQLNYLVKHYPSVVLCHYDAAYAGIAHLFSAITVHRHLLVDGALVRDHPFYIPVEKYAAMPPEDRECDLRDVFREVGFDLEKLFSTLAGYGQLQRQAPPEA